MILRDKAGDFQYATVSLRTNLSGERLRSLVRVERIRIHPRNNRIQRGPFRGLFSIEVKQMIREYCGKSKEDMKKVLYFMCDVQEELELTEEERDMYETAIQCITTVLNSMEDE